MLHDGAKGLDQAAEAVNLLDVLAGASVAVFSYFVFEYLSEKTALKRWFERLAGAI